MPAFITNADGSDFVWAAWMGTLLVDNPTDNCFMATVDDTIQDISCDGGDRLRLLCQFNCPSKANVSFTCKLAYRRVLAI